MNNEFLVAFINAYSQLVVPVVATTLAMLIVSAVRFIEKKIKEAQPELFEELQWYAQMAVLAAEQAGAAELIDDKKEYAISIVEKWLETYGFKGVDIRLIEAAIEKAVLEEFGKEPVDEETKE